MKLMMIDGNSIINRAFYGVRMLTAPDGTPTNGVYGFVSILLKLLSDERPDGVCVAFDMRAPTFRHRQYELYKAQRKGMPEELAVQMPILRQVLEAMGIMYVQLEGYEADDLLGTMSRISADRGCESVIVTGDRDSFQLIDEHTRVLHVKSRMGQTETVNYTPERFFEEYGFEPRRIVDLKALMGDSSDNIPGVPGVGEKTAMDLIRRFGTLDSIYSGLADLDIKDGVRKKLSAGEDSARMSYALATIVTDAPIDFDPAQAVWDGSYTPGLYTLFRTLGFTRFIERLKLTPPAADAPSGAGVPSGQNTGLTAGVPDAPDASGISGSTPEGRTEQGAAAENIPGPSPSAGARADTGAGASAALPGAAALAGPFQVLSIDCREALDSALEEFERADTVYVRCASDMESIAFFVPAFPGRGWLLSRRDWPDGWDDALRRCFSGGIKKAGHGIKDIQRRCLAAGAGAEGWVFDSALAAYLLDATAGNYDLDRLCIKYFSVDIQPPEAARQLSLLDEDGSADSKRGELLVREAAAIACLRPVLSSELAALGMTRLYEDIELPLCRVLAGMEQEGFWVDRQALADFGAGLTGAIEDLEQSIWDMAGGSFNINSPRQLGTVLFEKLMLPAGKKTKTGWSTNADILEKLRDKHPIIERILDYRTLTKLKSTYADGLLKVIGPDGRIHTSFQMTVTATGRLSSTEPNLQNIPVRKELGGQIRRMFVAGPGKVLVDADYSQIELRLLAHISQDRNMIAAFKNGEDIHTVTASQVFGVPPEQVTRTQRSHAKAVNFGIVYGISAWSLAQDIGVTPAQAKEYMDAYLLRYSGVRDYQRDVVARARADGYVSTLFGRRRALPELKSSNFAMRSFGERVAMNMPIQGTAADVIKLAMVNVCRAMEEQHLRSRLILQVHDELIAECPEDEAEAVSRLISREMERAVELSVPLIAEAHIGRSWADAH